LPKPWRILYSIPNFDTAGSGKALLNIAKRLDKSCFEPHVCCSHDRGIFFQDVIASGIPIHLYQTTVDMTPRIQGLISCIKLASYFRTLKVDLIHSFHYGPDYSEPLAARLAGIPWVYTKKNMNWGGKSKNGWRLRTILASHILAQNNDMILRYFSGKNNISLVPRGVDLKEFSPRLKNKGLLKDYKILKDEKVIITVANLVQVKGIEILLDAFELLSKNQDSIRLFIIGAKESEYGKKMEERAMQSPYSSRIHFTGKVQNVSIYYSIADIFVLPTLDEGRREGCPVALLEAMACDNLRIASEIPGVKDVLYNFPEHMFEAGNKEDLRNTIEKMLSNRKSEQYKNKFRLYIKQHYSIEREVNQHQAVYRKCLNR